MQGSDDNKRTGVAPVLDTEAKPQQEVIRADTDLYGDEADVPARSRKPKSASQKTKKKQSKKNAKSKFHLFARLTAAEAAYSRKTHALFEIVSSDDENHRFKSVMIYGHRIPFWPLVILAALFTMIALVFMNNSNMRVVEEKVTVVGLPADLENYRVLVISDLNGRRFGDKQSALLRTIGNIDYDSVLFLGDMVGAGGDPEPFYELLDGIPSSKEKYFVCGDADPGPLVDTPRDIVGTLSQLVLEDWILGAMERGAVYVDSPTSLTVGSSTIWFTPSTLMNMEASELLSLWKEQTEQEEDGVLSGLEADYISLPLTSYRYRIAQNFYNTVDTMAEEDFHMILSHAVPSEKSIRTMADRETGSGKYLPEPDLVLAGHYCGGVWRLPILGAFYAPDNMLARNGWFPAQEDVRGLSSSGESQTYITGGLSINSATPVMAFRLFNQPEISVLNLTATLPENMLSAE